MRPQPITSKLLSLASAVSLMAADSQNTGGTSNPPISPFSRQIAEPLWSDDAEADFAFDLQLKPCEFPEIALVKLAREKLSSYRDRNHNLYFISIRRDSLKPDLHFRLNKETSIMPVYLDLTAYHIVGEQDSDTDLKVLEHIQKIRQGKCSYRLFCPTAELNPDHIYSGRNYLFAGQVLQQERKLRDGLTHTNIAYEHLKTLRNLNSEDSEFSFKIKSINKALTFAEKAMEDHMEIELIREELGMLTSDSRKAIDN